MDKTTYEVRLANWTSVVEQCMSREPGITISQWCKANAISEKQYYYWQRRVRSHVSEHLPATLPVPQAPAEVTFAEVKIPTPMERSTCTSDNENERAFSFQPDVLIRKGDLIIGISNRASDRILGRIMREVSNAC